MRQAAKLIAFQIELFPLHSPLLGESLLVSFPPLNNMLKFSGCSRLNSGRISYRLASLRRRRRRTRGPTRRKLTAGSPFRNVRFVPTDPARHGARARPRRKPDAYLWATEARSLRRSSGLALSEPDSLWIGDPEADVVPGSTRDRNSRSEGRRSMCSAIHITSRT